MQARKKCCLGLHNQIDYATLVYSTDMDLIRECPLGMLEEKELHLNCQDFFDFMMALTSYVNY